MPSEKIPIDMKLKIMNDGRIKNKNKTASKSNYYKKRKTSNGKTKNLNNNEKTLNILKPNIIYTKESIQQRNDNITHLIGTDKKSFDDKINNLIKLHKITFATLQPLSLIHI